MAIPIASFPVLTGEVARRFEAEAQGNYERFLNRTADEKRLANEQYQARMVRLRRMLSKAHLGD